MSPTTSADNPENVLAEYLNQVHPLTPKAAAYLNRHSFHVQLRKGEFLAVPGQQETNLYYITRGVIRSYFEISGREITTWINEEHEIVGTITNFGLSTPNEEFMQALEPCELIGIPQQSIDFCYRHFPETNIIGRILLEGYYRDAEERVIISRIPSAVKRYQRFEQRFPNLLYRVPLKYIASYLGMTHETLCRLRARQNTSSRVAL